MNILQKNSILLLGFLLSLWVCFVLAITPTLELKSQVDVLKKKHFENQQILSNLNSLLLQKKQYDQLLEKHHLSSRTSLQNNLLEVINQFGKENKLSIISFNKPHSFNNKNTRFKTYSFKVRGSYSSILKLIHSLEQKYSFGKISSCSFEKKKNYRTYRSYLDCEIFIQQISGSN